MKSRTSLQAKCAEAAGELAVSFAFSRSVGQIYAYLYMSPEPLDLDAVCDGLGISKGNGSMNLRTLEEWGAVRKAWVKGSRRAHYVPDRDLKSVILKRVHEGLSRRVERARTLIDSLAASADVSDEFSRRQIGEISSFLRLTDKAVSLLPRAETLMKSRWFSRL